jgi:outer membrane lipoprotein SlyB
MNKVVWLLLVSISLFLTGCATTQLQTQAKMTRTISLSPKVLEDKRVLLRVTGTQASILELEEPLKKALMDRGVVLVDNADLATISLHVNTLFADNLKEAANYGSAVAGGVIGGALAKANGNSSGNSILIGVGVALAMGVADRALADETYRAVIDVSFRERDLSNNTWKDEDKTRVLVEAVKMGLDKKEAKPIMEEKAIYQIAELLK